MLRSLLCACAVFALLGPGGAPTASGDSWDDVEVRLKSTGVDALLARRIAISIRRGTKWLLEQTEPEALRVQGQIAGGGYGLLAAAALRHTGDGEACERARELLARYGSERVDFRQLGTYGCGLLGTLLQMENSSSPLVARLRKILALGAKRSEGWWGYVPDGPGGNLSTAQFAALGLWACERQLGSHAPEAWLEHLEALLRNQDELGSWPYDPEDGMPSYSHGTCMGLAGLLLAEHVLKEWLEAHPGERAATVVARHRAWHAFRRHSRWMLRPVPLGYAWHRYYGLYALEKVAVFGERESYGGHWWYLEGARILLKAQQESGGWSEAGGGAAEAARLAAPSDLVGTSFALLFLLRASEIHRPITPRAVPVPGRGHPRPVTPSAETPPIAPSTPAGEAAPAPGAQAGQDGAPARDPDMGPPALLARVALDALARGPERLKPAHLGAALQHLRIVRRTLEHDQTDAPGQSEERRAWRAQAETLLIGLAVPRTSGTSDTGMPTLALALEALSALAQGAPSGGSRLRDAIDAWSDGHGARPPQIDVAWTSTAYETLRALATPGLAPWLAARVRADAPRAPAGALAALVALGGLGDAPGPERLTAVRQLIQDPGTEQKLNAAGFGLDLLLAIQALAGEEATGPLSRALVGGVRADLTSTRAWLRDHGDARRPPWSAE